MRNSFLPEVLASGVTSSEETHIYIYARENCRLPTVLAPAAASYTAAGQGFHMSNDKYATAHEAPDGAHDYPVAARVLYKFLAHPRT